MTHKRAKHRDAFTIEEANAMLPLVRAIVADLTELFRDVNERRRRLSFLLAGRNPNDHDLYHEELVQIEQELEKDTRRLHDFREELRALGVESENGPEGYVDFPSILDGRKVCLCWKLGEPELLFWHDRDANCTQQRHFLTVESIAGAMPGDAHNGE
jgi:hypothetical protein